MNPLRFDLIFVAGCFLACLGAPFSRIAFVWTVNSRLVLERATQSKAIEDRRRSSWYLLEGFWLYLRGFRLQRDSNPRPVLFAESLDHTLTEHNSGLPDPNRMILGVLSMYKRMPCNPPGSHSLILSHKKVDLTVFRLTVGLFPRRD